MSELGPRAPARVRVRRWRRLAERWPALAVVAVTIPVAAAMAHGTLYWWDRPFPGFFVAGNAVVPSVGLYHWTGMQSGMPFHSRVVAVDDTPVTGNREVYDYVAARPAGTAVRYTLVKNGETTTRVVPTMRFTAEDYWLTVGLLLAFGLLSIGAGVVVAVLQPRTRAARAFLSQAFFTGMYGLTATALYNPALWPLSPLQLLAQAVFPAAFIHLGLVFPEERRSVQQRPWLCAVPYAVSAVLAVWLSIDFYRTPPRLTALYATFLYAALAIIVLIGLVAYSFYEARTPAVRTRLHAVLPGLVLGTALALYGFLDIARSGGTFPINLIALAPVIFYLSIGNAIVRHDLFDIDHFMKQAAVYGTLTLTVSVGYAAIVAAVGWLVPASRAAGSSTFTVAFIVVVAIAIQPFRAAIQEVVDRTFYRSRLDYRRTVSGLSTALTSLLDLDEILGRLGRTVSEGLHLRSLAVALWLEETPELWRYDADRDRMERIAWQSTGALLAALSGRAGRAWVPDPRTATGEATAGGEAACAEAAALAASLLVPLAIRGRTIGALALGTRRSGRHFSAADVDLLGTLAAQTAIAVQNAGSYRALQTMNEALEAKVRARTTELEASSSKLAASNVELARAYHNLQAAQAQLVTTEKMASLGLVVAGVAHEINNPLSFIIGNVEPLNQTLARLADLAAEHGDARVRTETDRLGKILGLMTLGAERTASIVQDLRTFSRIGETHPVAAPTDVHEALEVSLRLLRPRWADRIAIHRRFGALGPIDGVPGQINQVLMNILANACDAIPGTGNIWVETRTLGPRLVIAVRDDGGGINPENLGRIFDPFFTTKPMGQGTGLGLAITRGLVTHHGGTIEVTSEIGRGSEFRIAFPLRQGGARFERLDRKGA